MKPILSLSLFITAVMIISPSAKSENLPLESEAKLKIKQFATELKSELSNAIQQGGLTNGITICHTMAPQIAKNFSYDGWELSRISLKNRNPYNAPNDSEKQTLMEFQKRLDNGEPINNLVTIEHSESEFKLIKAIPLQPLCLSCHGKNIDDEVKEKLLTYYPNDIATGYGLSDIRGAFVVKKKI